MRIRQGHAAIDRAHKAQVPFVFQQGDARLAGGLGAQPFGQLRLRAGVVDDDEPPGCFAAAGQHRFDAAARVLQPAIDGDDDVHGRIRRGQGLGRGGGLGAGRADAQQVVETHLGVNDGARDAKDGGVFNVR